MTVQEEAIGGSTGSALGVAIDGGLVLMKSVRASICVKAWVLSAKRVEVVDGSAGGRASHTYAHRNADTQAHATNLRLGIEGPTEMDVPCTRIEAKGGVPHKVLTKVEEGVQDVHGG